MPNLSTGYIKDSSLQIFTGRIQRVDTVKIKLAKSKGKLFRSARERKRMVVIAVIEVKQQFTSKIKTKTIAVKTGVAPFMDCGFPFVLGKDLLLVTRINESKQHYTSICFSTKPVNKAEKDLKLLSQELKVQVE